VAVAPRIGLVLHPTRDCSAAVGQVAAWTTTHGVDLVAARADVARLGTPTGVRAVPDAELAGGCDGVIALGGDGTLLGAMRLVSQRPVPVLGVNLGTLGFLAEVEDDELDAALTAMAEDHARTEPRSALEVTGPAGRLLAFNDVVVARVPGTGMVAATVAVAGRPYGHYRCDAVILATPMGSTAYSYAAGGPVVSPGADGIVLTPSAPMGGIARSVVLGPAEDVRLELTAGRPVLEVDGLAGETLAAGDVLTVRLRPDAGHLVRIQGSLADVRSRVKLSLLDLPVLPEELVELLPASARRRLPGGASRPD
jgi:NAD+ kinase